MCYIILIISKYLENFVFRNIVEQYLRKKQAILVVVITET